MSGQRVAEAVRRNARAEAGRARNVVMGEVVKRRPLKIDLHHSAITLDDGDFDLSAWTDTYDAEYGLRAGDTVLLLREKGNWVVFDVIPSPTQHLVKAKSIRAALRVIRRRLSNLEARVSALES